MGEAAPRADGLDVVSLHCESISFLLAQRDSLALTLLLTKAEGPHA
jgi:hypothetical protein